MRTSRIPHDGLKHTALSILFSSLLLTVVLTACGSASSGAGSTPASTPTAPTIVKGYGTAYGCPSDSVVNAVTTANVTVKYSQVNSTISVHNGDLIEFQLPFGQRWTGPFITDGHLEAQTPAGYALKASRMCVWRFVAKGTGVTHLEFHGQAICKPGQMCPQYVLAVPFTVEVK